MRNAYAIYSTVTLALTLLGRAALAEPSPARPGKPEPAAHEVKLTKLTFARKLEARRPVEAAESFSTDGGRIYGHLELENRGEPTRVVMIWERDGKVRQRSTLIVGRGKSWRTWSYLRAVEGSEGEWKVKVLDARGTALGEGTVTIGGGC